MKAKKLYTHFSRFNPTKQPDFIIAGVQKCGTSSLMRTLATHPLLYLPDGEVHFFDRHQDEGLDWYRSHFPDDGRTVGEKTPAYFKMEKLWVTIKETLPDAKIILSLRDPVGRALSHWNMMNRKGATSYPLNGLPEDWEMSMIRQGDYYDAITKFLKFFDREKVLVVIAEETWREPDRVYSEIQQFLEVPYFRLVPVPQKSNAYPKLSLEEITFKNWLVERYKEPNMRLFEWLGREIKCWT